jgi:DegV family protein with EDD domain
VVPFYVSFDNVTYQKEGVDVTPQQFYQLLQEKKGIYPKSSMPTTDDYYEAFLPWVKENKAILCLCITTKFSGSFNSAQMAKQMIIEQYPLATIEVMDTRVNTVLQGLVVEEACKARDLGWSLKQTMDKLEETIPSGRILFTIGGLDYLSHGGRIGKLASILGDKLHIKPLIELKNGDITAKGITFARTKALLKVLGFAKKHFEAGLDVNNYEMVIGYGADMEEAKHFYEKVKEAFSTLSIKFRQIGATISVHTGPNPLGIAFIQKIA